MQLIDEAAEAVTDPSWRNELLTRRFFVMSFRSGPRATVEAASALPQRSRSAPLDAAHAAAFYGLARLGRLDDAIRQLSPPAAAQRYQRLKNRGNGGPCLSPVS